MTVAKRRRERALAERRREKLERRIGVRQNQRSNVEATDGVDPDIADIVPDRQPPLAWQVEE
jgi:hypothetical protein